MNSRFAPKTVTEMLAKSSVELLKKERWRFQQEWHEIFSAPVKEKFGKYTYRGFDWHTFSYGFTKALSGARAEEEYQQQSCDELIILGEGNKNPSLKFRCCKPPMLVEFREDIYIFPANLEWTMVFTHLPTTFFSRKEWII